nr:hypothetical protein [Tanacetum cinerariifolium]
TMVTSAQPAPTSEPAKPREKKRKQATETSDKPPKAKKSEYGLVNKKRTLKNVAASKAEDVLIMEPQVAAEDAELQKAGSNLDETFEGQAGSNPDETSEGQAGPDPDVLELRYNLFQVLWFTLEQTVNTWILMLLMSHLNLSRSN